MPEVPAEVRAHWRSEAAKARPGALHAVLAHRDPEMAARLSPGDTQRIVRALEVLEASGESLLEWQRRPREPVLNIEEAACLVVAPERAELCRRIDARFAAMLEAGALEEAARLGSQGLDPTLPIMGALGVRPLLRHLQGELSRREAVAAAQAESRQYAKRQLTWARGNMLAWRWLAEKETERNEAEAVTFIDHQH
jgi:tRNA dimethylallyltransferase